MIRRVVAVLAGWLRARRRARRFAAAERQRRRRYERRLSFVLAGRP
jgi:hypothetical protein